MSHFLNSSQTGCKENPKLQRCASAEQVAQLTRQLGDSYLYSRSRGYTKMIRGVEKAFQLGRHVLLEVTGANRPFEWIFEYCRRFTPKHTQYIVTLFVPIVSDTTLTNRVIARFDEAMACAALQNDPDATRNESCPPPRLPNVWDADVLGVERSHHYLIKECLTDDRLHHVLLYNNECPAERACLSVDIRNTGVTTATVVHQLIREWKEFGWRKPLIRGIVQHLVLQLPELQQQRMLLETKEFWS